MCISYIKIYNIHKYIYIYIYIYIYNIHTYIKIYKCIEMHVEKYFTENIKKYIKNRNYKNV